MRRLSLGLVGVGGIGSTILTEAAEGRLRGRVVPVAVCDRNRERLAWARRLFPDCEVTTRLEEALEWDCDVLVEAASVEAAAELLPGALERTDVIVLSVGALVLEEGLLEECLEACERSGHRLFVPSGAVGGLDVLRAVDGRVEEVVLTTVKPPESLDREVEDREVVFEGSVREAVRRFPRNVNVAAAVALAVGDPSRVRVRIVCDPDADRNTHVVEVRSELGEYRFELRNAALPENPRTSALAAYSTVALLERLTEGLRVGT